MAPGQTSASGSDDSNDRTTVPSSRQNSTASMPRSNHKDLPWCQQIAVDWKQKNLLSMWEKGLSLVMRRGTDKVMQTDADMRKMVTGALLSTAFHQPNGRIPATNLQKTIPWPWDDPNRTATLYGVVFSKFRKFIVVWEHEKHWLCVPIFTHKGRGLDLSQKKTEHMAIRDSRSDLTLPLKPKDDCGFLVAEMAPRVMSKAGKTLPSERMTNSAYVHPTNLVSVLKEAPLAYEGHLVNGDAQRLKRTVLSLLE